MPRSKNPNERRKGKRMKNTTETNETELLSSISMETITRLKNVQVTMGLS